MRVLNIIDGPGWSGGVEQTLLLARGMVTRGIDTAIACHRDNTILLREARATGIEVTGFEEGSRRNPENYRRLRAIAARGFDVLIGHKPKSVVYALAARALLTSQPRVIAVRRVSRPISRLSSLTKYRLPDRVVAVSRNVSQVLRDAGVPPGKIACVPSGVDLDRFRARRDARERLRADWGLDDRVTVIIQVANFTDKKGHRFLMKALADAAPNIGEFRLVLAGRDTDGDACRALASGYGIADRVLGLGMRRDVETLLSGADLFVFPSLPGIDAIAGAVLQAMATGLPAISTAIGGIPEYITDGETGFLVPPGDAGALAARIRQVLAMPPDDRRRIASRGEALVRGEYGIERTVDAYVALCRELVTSRDRTGAAS